MNTSDTSSSYIKHNGLLFNTFSISNKTVDNSVNDNLPIDFFKHFFTIPTNLSQNPHHQDAQSKLNFHMIPRSEQNNRLACDLNTVPLSDMIFFGQALLAINFLRLFMKFLLLLSSTKSRLTDLDVAHVNITIYALCISSLLH